MLELVKYRKGDLAELMKQPELFYLADYVTPECDDRMVAATFSHTVLKEGKPLLCAGIHEYWTGRGEAWAVFDQKCRKDFLALHHIVKNYLDSAPIRRVEAIVDIGFRPGHRWVKALGFSVEAERLEHYRPNGLDATLYVRVNRGI